MDRREFLKLVGLSTLGATASTMNAGRAEGAPGDARSRARASGRHILEMDNATAGVLIGYSGGLITTDVVNEALVPGQPTRKHLGKSQPEPLVVECGTGMSRAFMDSVKSFTQRRNTRHSGALISCDYDYKALSRVEFTDALITSLAMPALDAASKDAASLSVSISPSILRLNRLKGGASQADKFSAADAKQKKWLPSNFRLRIDRLDDACARVAKIDPLVWEMKAQESSVGTQRDTSKDPTALVVPDLVLTVPDAFADPFYQWYDEFVVRGGNSDAAERKGTLEYLAPNRTDILYTLTFSHLGIYAIEPDSTEGSSETVRKVKVRMYCEDITFDYASSYA